MCVCRCLFLFIGVLAYAQDPFEIQVFEYEPLPRGAYTYEAHINYAPISTKQSSGSAAPLQNQLHLSSEFTAGVNNEVRAGIVQLSAVVPGHGVEYAGFRLLPHFYAPQSWGLPLNLGFVVEFSFERPLFNQNSRAVELRGIAEKHIGRLQMDSNLVAERALHGPGTRDGWEFEPSGRVGWEASPRFTPSLEYYGYLGSFSNFLPAHQQVHLLFPGADWRPSAHITWSFGVGFGLTETRMILKSRIQFDFGRKRI